MIFYDFMPSGAPVFILIITCLGFCLRNERFVVTVQKFCPKGSYWIKPSETLSFLVHFILFAICITFLLVKILLSTVLESVNFTVSLFGHIFKYRITITFLFLTFEHERIFQPGKVPIEQIFQKISSQQKHTIWIIHSKDRFTHARELFQESKIFNVFQLDI